MKRVHYTDQYLINPQHPVTVNLVGAGGTGCRVLSHLAALDTSLQAFGHPGIHVTVYDPDIVTDANRGRQLFSRTEIGLNKAVCLVSRINNFFGSDWRAVPAKYPTRLKEMSHKHFANITLTCTDNIQSRLDMGALLGEVGKATIGEPYARPVYWMDFGNTKTSGQVVLGTVCGKVKQPVSKEFISVDKLKTVTEIVDYSLIEESDSGPSCSQAEALEYQDLYINSALAVFGCDILWKLFRQGFTEYSGAYVSLETMRVNPVSV